MQFRSEDFMNNKREINLKYMFEIIGQRIH